MAEAPRGGKGANAARTGSPGTKKATHFKAVASKPLALSADDKQTRTKGWHMLADALSAGISGGHHLLLAGQVERSVFAATGGSMSKFKDRVRALNYNLTHNTHLRDKVLSGAILPLDLAAMTSKEMASEELKNKRDAAAEASKFDVLQTEEFLQLKQQAAGAQLLKAQGLIDQKKEDDEAERREKEAREQEEAGRQAELDALAAAHAKSIVDVGEEDEQAYLKNVKKWRPTYADDVHAGSNGEAYLKNEDEEAYLKNEDEEAYRNNYSYLEPLTDDDDAGEDEDQEMECASSPTLDLPIGTESSNAAILESAAFEDASTRVRRALPTVGPPVMQTRVAGCLMRATLVPAKNSTHNNVLKRIPDWLGLERDVDLQKAIEYLLEEPGITVVEFEPEGRDDEEAYTSLAESLLRSRRAGVILDTKAMFMYLLPPCDAAGSLLQPPADTCANMLGVLICPHPPSSQGA